MKLGIATGLAIGVTPVVGTGTGFCIGVVGIGVVGIGVVGIGVVGDDGGGDATNIPVDVNDDGPVGLEDSHALPHRHSIAAMSAFLRSIRNQRATSIPVGPL
jgi:hypothetical protein